MERDKLDRDGSAWSFVKGFLGGFAECLRRQPLVSISEVLLPHIPQP